MWFYFTLFLVWIGALAVCFAFSLDDFWTDDYEGEHNYYWMLIGGIPVRLHSSNCRCDV